MKCAQRRPESELRQHSPASARCRGRDRSLNEGRSLNSGNTAQKSTYMGVMSRAQRRPESELRQHPYRREPGPLGRFRRNPVVKTTDRVAELHHRGALSHNDETIPLSNPEIFRRFGRWIENHRRFAISLTGPTACPERAPEADPNVALQLLYHRENGRGAQCPGLGR